MSSYTYGGNKLTDDMLRNQICIAVRDERGRCIQGRNGNTLVEFDYGGRCVVLARQHRKIKPPTAVAVGGYGAHNADASASTSIRCAL